MARAGGRRGGAGSSDDALGGDRMIDRLLEQLDEAPPGLHDLGEPSGTLPADWPLALRQLYAAFDGGRFFHEQVELRPAADVERDGAGRLLVGTCDGDPIAVDDRGRVWRHDQDIDDHLVDGTRPDRWLAGVLDACALLFDNEGEFFEDAFDEEGQVTPQIIERQIRAQLRRDPGAPGPRWRLARSLLASDQRDLARHELETVVDEDPQAAWAWLDLARVSEQVGELDGALDEATVGAEAARGSTYEGLFWAQVARLAAAKGDEARRAVAAERALTSAPELKAAQIAGARTQLTAGDRDSARGLVALLRAIAPLDLDVLTLAREVETAVLPERDGGGYDA